MIRVHELSKNYGSVAAVRGLTFEIGRAQVVGFLGPNGAGKSTTIKMLLGYISPTSGAIEIADRKHIGYLPENNPLYEDMMVHEYLDFVTSVRGFSKKERREAIEKTAQRCGITPVLKRDIGKLSRGYRQRVGLAQAIIHEPQILILDEPTSGLDPNQIMEVRRLIQDLGRSKTVLMSTHILSEAQTTCSRILIIHEGKLVADDTAEELAREHGRLDEVFQRLTSPV